MKGYATNVRRAHRYTRCPHVCLVVPVPVRRWPARAPRRRRRVHLVAAVLLVPPEQVGARVRVRVRRPPAALRVLRRELDDALRVRHRLDVLDVGVQDEARVGVAGGGGRLHALAGRGGQRAGVHGHGA